MRLVSAHISQWDVKFAGEWDSAVKGNSALRAHGARAAARSEGSIKTTRVGSATCGKFFFFIEILVLGSLTQTNHRDIFKLATDTATSSMVVHPAF